MEHSCLGVLVHGRFIFYNKWMNVKGKRAGGGFLFWLPESLSVCGLCFG
jgi:hypothetical protein